MSNANAVPEQAVEAALRSWFSSNHDEEPRISMRAALTVALPLMGVQREDVARIIDEWAWRIGTSDDQDPPSIEMIERWKAALAKADAILALPHTGQPQEGWRERAAEIVKRYDTATAAQTAADAKLMVMANYGDLAIGLLRALSVASASPRAEDGVTFCYVTYKECDKNCPSREDCALGVAL